MRTLLVIIALSLGMLGASTAGAAPSYYVVTAAPRYWVVSNMQAAYEPDDPQLVGRRIGFDGETMTFDGGPIKCARPVVATARVSAGRLFRSMFPDRTTYGRLHIAAPAAFGLRFPVTTKLVLTSIRCATGKAKQPYYLGAAMFTLPDGRKVAWLGDVEDHLLILRPVTAPIRPSFDCARAASLTERTICGDPDLAGWDVSVAKTLSKLGDKPEDDQRGWLVERDRCGADKDCLWSSMSARVRNLLH